MKNMYRAKPKNGIGATWYVAKEEIFKTYAKAVDEDGFETIIDLRQYDLCR